jgi:hypothetical protein
MKYEYNRLKYIRVQRFMNIRMAKAFRTLSSESLCILAGMTPIIIKIEEEIKQHNVIRGKGSQTQLIDREVGLKNLPHAADAVRIIEAKEYKEQTIQIYIDRSKNEHGVGPGVPMFVGK